MTVNVLRRNAGFTLIELLIVVAIIGVIAAIAIPALQRARMSANESSAVSSLRAVNSGQMSYAAACGGGSFAPTLPTLGVPPPGGGQGFLPGELSMAVMPQKSGYRYTLGAGLGAVPGLNDCNGSPTTTAYYATAVPTAPSTTGSRGFATNPGGAVWQNIAVGALAPIEPFTVTPTISPLQ